MFCTNCGSPIADGDRFCSICGQPTELTPSAPGAPVPPAEPVPPELSAPPVPAPEPPAPAAEAVPEMTAPEAPEEPVPGPVPPEAPEEPVPETVPPEAPEEPAPEPVPLEVPEVSAPETAQPETPEAPVPEPAPPEVPEESAPEPVPLEVPEALIPGAVPLKDLILEAPAAPEAAAPPAPAAQNLPEQSGPMPQGGFAPPPPGTPGFAPQGGFVPPPNVPGPQGGFMPPPGGGYAPPVPPQGYAEPSKKKKRVLPVILIALGVVILAAAGFFAFRIFSNNQAFDASMADGEKYMTSGDYDQAAEAFADAVDRKPKDADAALALARAYLCAGRFDEAGAALAEIDLDGEDERRATLDRLKDLAALDPKVEQVDAGSFPVVTLIFSRGSELPLTSGNFTITEGGTLREITGLEQNGGTVRVTFRSEDTEASDEPRSLNVAVSVDGVSYQDSAAYTTPHFEPAQLTLVSADVSQYPTVKAFFRVSNAVSGETVEGLNINSFTIWERVQGGEYLAREITSAVPLEGNAGLSIGLVADKSDSISPSDLEKVQAVMTEFVYNLHYDVGDRAELLAFDSIVQQMCYYTGDVSLLENGIRNMSTDGMTAFYDAVYDGVTNAALQGGARCVIAFTDGQDNRSRHTAGELVSYANAKQVPVYVIGVGRSVEEYTLRTIAQNTGGRYWHIDDLYDLQAIFRQIYSEQEELYVVEYESDAALDSYLTRDLSVLVSGGGCRAREELSFTPVRSILDNGGNYHASRYELFRESLSWEEASRRCQEMGGHLATITSQDEMDLLVSMAEDAGVKYVWLGGYTSYDSYGGVFGHWVTGEEFSYQAWSVNEPSRVDMDGTEEWYIMLWNIPSLGGWTWNDQRNDPAAVVTSMARDMAFICEFET